MSDTAFPETRYGIPGTRSLAPAAARFFAVAVTLQTLDLLLATLCCRQLDESMLDRGTLAIEALDIYRGHHPADTNDDDDEQDARRPDTTKSLHQPQPELQRALCHRILALS